MTETDEIDKYKRICAVYKASIANENDGKIQAIFHEDIEDRERTTLITYWLWLDEKLKSILMEDEGDAYENEATEILDYHDQFYELFVTIDNKLN